MGYHPRAEWTTVQSPIPQVTLRLDQIREARGQAQAVMIKAAGLGTAKMHSAHIPDR
jgi:hypothetical protein